MWVSSQCCQEEGRLGPGLPTFLCHVWVKGCVSAMRHEWLYQILSLGLPPP